MRMNGHAKPMPKRIDIDKVLSELTLVEKISLLTGSDLWHTTPLPDHGIPAVRLTDGREWLVERCVYDYHLKT
jgi:hypothetical protein